MRLSNVVSAAALILLVSASPSQGVTRPWTLDDLLALRQVTDPQVSPDGRSIAYVVNELNSDKSDFQTDVWLVASMDGEARRLTASPVADEFPRWSPDGRTLAFLSERPRPGVNAADPATDEGKRQIWMIRPDGGEAWIASSAKGGVSAFEWSHDGRRIAYLSREPKSDERRKAEKEKNDAYTPSMMYAWNRLWVMEVGSDKATQLTSGDFHVSSFSISPDGQKIVVSAQPTPLIPDNFKSDLYVIPVAGGKPAPLVTWKGADEQPAWSPDGRSIAFMSQGGAAEEWYANNHVCVVAATGGAPRNLTPDFDQRVQTINAGYLTWTPDGSAVMFQSARHTAVNLFRAFLDRHGVEPVTNGDAVDTAPSVDRLGDVLVFLREDGEHLREVWRASMPGGTAERLTNTNPEAAAFPAFPKQLVTWQGADGWPIEGLLIYPPGYRTSQPVPMIVNVHGGPAGVNSNTCTLGSRLYPLAMWAQKGYAILLPNPRGSDGYGAAFRAANVRDWGGKDYQDIMNGVDAMITRSIAEPSRLAVCGWSYGGFMTSTIVTRTDRFRAAVVGAGVTDLISMAGTCDIPEFNHSYFGAWPWEDAQVYVDHSALMHAGNVRTPTLIVHGGADERVPTSQGYEFYNALKRVGVPTDLLILPRQPHGPREPKLLRTCAQWHLDWIDRYTLGPPAFPRPRAKPASAAKSAAAAKAGAESR